MTASPSAPPNDDGKIENVPAFGELRIDKDLRLALVAVLGHEPSAREPAVVLAAYLHALKDSLGLSEHFTLDLADHSRVAPPPRAEELIRQLLRLPEGDLTVETVGDRLYEAAAALADDPEALRALNRKTPLHPDGLLLVVQVGWNLQRSDARPRLPIPTNLPLTSSSQRAHIKSPDRDADFAAMEWTKRMQVGVSGLGPGQAERSSGQGLRTKVALLAVLVARELVESGQASTMTVGGAELVEDGRRQSIIWPCDRDDAGGGSALQRARTPFREAGRVLIGAFAEVGERFQERTFETQLREIWAADDDRRVWLWGAPGLGKSYVARHVMQLALRDPSPERETLLIWADSATPQAVTHAFARAAERLGTPSAELSRGRIDVSDAVLARELLNYLATSENRWLVVLDNADAEALTAANLIPAGTNSNGRVLITTPLSAGLSSTHGHLIQVDSFSDDEAEAFLQSQVPRSTTTDRVRLAQALGNHPLALSIASSTIAANRLTVDEWLDDLAAQQLDVAADHPDTGGYPALIGATWRIVLERASQGLSQGELERAALVAAVSDPDGHPTWLWHRAAVAEWVAGDSSAPTSPHRMPRAVQRLVD